MKYPSWYKNGWKNKSILIYMVYYKGNSDLKKLCSFQILGLSSNVWNFLLLLVMFSSKVFDITYQIDKTNDSLPEYITKYSTGWCHDKTKNESWIINQLCCFCRKTIINQQLDWIRTSFYFFGENIPWAWNTCIFLQLKRLSYIVCHSNSNFPHLVSPINACDQRYDSATFLRLASQCALLHTEGIADGIKLKLLRIFGSHTFFHKLVPIKYWKRPKKKE